MILSLRVTVSDIHSGLIDKEEDIEAITKDFAKPCRLFILPMVIIARLPQPW